MFIDCRFMRRFAVVCACLGAGCTGNNLPETPPELVFVRGLYHEEARKGAIRLSRQYDEAYLTGRMGIALAESGRTEEAIAYHKEAIALAKKREIPQLEGEQLSMLALAYLEKEDPMQARSYCQSAIELFAEAELEEEVVRAQKLLVEIG